MLTHPFSRLDASTKELFRLPKNKEAFKTLQEIFRGFEAQGTLIQKNNYLHELHHENEVLFYAFIQTYLVDILPALYTPTVAERVRSCNQGKIRPKGLYISWEDRDRLDLLLDSYPSNRINIAILTDGERILGLKDQGAGGLEICVAKAMLYVACAGLAPDQLLPIYIDVGTNNTDLLQSPNYPGWRHPRLNEVDYMQLMDRVIAALRAKFSKLYLHWEDLERDHANILLNRYKSIAAFNDDIQGTGVVTLAAALNAVKITKIPLTEQRIVIFGGGAAGLGIAEQLCYALEQAGLSALEARRRLWLVGRHGLLFEDSSDLKELQQPYARPSTERPLYDKPSAQEPIQLLDLVKHISPTFLIGCSGHAGAFSQEVVSAMQARVDRPIIFSLSNPVDCCEATPHDLLAWTHHEALVATGSPFAPVMVKGQAWPIAQCNNALVFPGIGLGAQAVTSKPLTKLMLWNACVALCEATPPSSDYPPVLLPSMQQAGYVSQMIAKGLVAFLKHSTTEENERYLQQLFKRQWQPFV